jgi:exodeoxyribonuclease-1
MLSPLSVLNDAAMERLALDRGVIESRANELPGRQVLIERLSALFATDKAGAPGAAQDPELALYDGFVPRTDSAIYPRIRQADAEELKRLGRPFQDDRLNRLLFRYRARRFPDSLDEAERRRWMDYRRRRLLDDPDLGSIRSEDFDAELAARIQAGGDAGILSALSDWRQGLNLDALR